MKAAMGKTTTHNGKYIHNRSLVRDSQEKSTKIKRIICAYRTRVARMGQTRNAQRFCMHLGKQHLITPRGCEVRKLREL
jgi:hypothetical protein